MDELVPSQFDTALGIGEYPVTVLDQANAMATYAARGVRASAHFVIEVRRQGEVVFAEPAQDRQQTPILDPAAYADLSWALSQRPAVGQLDEFISAVATGTAPMTNMPDSVAHAWTVGYTSGFAMAVWVGNAGPERALRTKDGDTIYGSGLPASIYRRVMTTAHVELGIEAKPFPKPTLLGNLHPPFSAGES